MEQKIEKAIFASGCFWCGEAIFEELKGVVSVESGYAGPPTKSGKPPTYEEVSSGKSGYAEAIQLTFEPAKISYRDLLEVFWVTHDPTQLNRQGPDVGHQYRSAIFYLDENQKKAAEESKRRLGKSGEFDPSSRTLRVHYGAGKPIVTEIVPLDKFYPAEEHHQDFYERNPDAPYCQVVINPKLEKFREKFRNRLK